MKIVCEHCGAKYQIPEEKVQGRIFKFNCNKCDEVIQVDNSSAAGGGFDDAADWYIVVDDEQVGPITASQIGEYIAAGRFSAAGYVWKEGFPDWLPLHDVEELASLNVESLSNSSDYYAEDEPAAEGIQNQYDAAPSYDQGYQDQSAFQDQGGFQSVAPFTNTGSDQGGFQSVATFDNAPVDQGGAFASFASTSGGPASSSSDSAGGLFAAFDNASSSSNSSFAGSSAPSGMIGQRSESSVLFSLSSLQQVSTQAQAKDASKGSVTEGSGLIDLQALASAHSALGAGDDADDPFASSSMALPPLAPMGSHKSNTPLILGATIGGVLLLALLGVVVYLLMQSKQPEQPVAQQAPVQKVIVREVIRESPEQKEEEKEAVAAAEKAKKVAAANKKKAEEAEKAKDEEAEKEEPSKKEKEDDNDDNDKGGSRGRRSGRSRSHASRDDDDRPSRKSNRRDVEALVKEVKKEAPQPKPSAGLSKNQVLATIRKYIPRISSCGRSANSSHLSGRMLVKFEIRPNGAVTGVRTSTPKFNGTDVASCVTRVVSGMRFPASGTNDNLPITYPFDI